MTSNVRSKVATGPTIEHPASPTIISISAEIIASSSTIRIRRPASLTPGLDLLSPASGEASGSCRFGGLTKGRATASDPQFPGLSLRTERDLQIDPQPVPF